MAIDFRMPEPPRWLIACALAGLALASAAAGCSSPDREAERLAPTYADILVRELRTDGEVLREVRDSLAVQQGIALLWIEWIDDQEVTASHTLMEGARNLSQPQSFTLRRRVVGEMDRNGHWQLIPDPALREDLARYHSLGQGFGELGREAVWDLRSHLSATLEPEEWIWAFEVPEGEIPPVQFREAVRQFWNHDFRTVMRMMAVSLAEQRARVDELLDLNADLENRVRAWRDEA